MALAVASLAVVLLSAESAGASQPLRPVGLLSQRAGPVGVAGSVRLAGPMPPGGVGAASGEPLGQGEAFLSSLVVPGLAQYRQGNRRWIAYAGIEVLFAAWYVDARGDARGMRTAYRDFAWTRARLGVSSQPRREGDFEYYERLSQWVASGAWDADPLRDGVQPESDPATYNGSVWALAAEIYNVDLADPERSAGYPRALEHYRMRGYGPDLLWAWRPGSGDRDRLRTMISDSDRLARDARRALWTIVANHLLSAIDGFITARLAVAPPLAAPLLVVTLPVP